MTPQQQLLSEVEAFMAGHRMSATTFGLNAVKDGKLVPRLRRGDNLTLRTIERVQAYMRDFKPEASAA